MVEPGLTFVVWPTTRLNAYQGAMLKHEGCHDGINPLCGVSYPPTSISKSTEIGISDPDCEGSLKVVDDGTKYVAGWKNNKEHG